MLSLAIGLLIGTPLGILIMLVGDRDLRRFSYTVGWESRGVRGLGAELPSPTGIDADIDLARIMLDSESHRQKGAR